MANRTTKRNISKLKPGEEVTLHFHGSRALGNEAHDLDAVFIKHDTDPDLGHPTAIFHIDNTELEAYRTNNRWRYGASAEMLTAS